MYAKAESLEPIPGPTRNPIASSSVVGHRHSHSTLREKYRSVERQNSLKLVSHVNQSGLYSRVCSIIKLLRGCAETKNSFLTPALPQTSIITAAVLLSASAMATENPLLSYHASKEISVNDWIAYDKTTSLSDGTQLFQYVAEVSAEIDGDTKPAGLDPVIRFSFIPRFNCTPIISVVSPTDSKPGDERRAQLLTALSALKFSIDGSLIEFPVLTESQSEVVAAHYDTNLERRKTLRLLIEVGRKSVVSITGFGDFEFSLIGSMRAIERSRERCANHTV